MESGCDEAVNGGLGSLRAWRGWSPGFCGPTAGGDADLEQKCTYLLIKFQDTYFMLITFCAYFVTYTSTYLGQEHPSLKSSNLFHFSLLISLIFT